MFFVCASSPGNAGGQESRSQQPANCLFGKHDRPFWRGGRVAEGNGLLNRRTGNTVPGVRIPPSPPSRPRSASGCRAGASERRRAGSTPCRAHPDRPQTATGSPDCGNVASSDGHIQAGDIGMLAACSDYYYRSTCGFRARKRYSKTSLSTPINTSTLTTHSPAIISRGETSIKMRRRLSDIDSDS